MANYSLVATPTFQGRSFDEMLKPLAMYSEVYNTIENNINELDTKASVWETMANKETDPIAYERYKRYADSLRASADNLATHGLSAMSRKDILDLKRRYSAEITPIEQAYAARAAQAKEQTEAMLKDPTLFFSRKASTTSLDDYLANPQLSYNSYSGALLQQQVGTAAAALAKELRDYGYVKNLDSYTKTWLENHGYTSDDVARAVAHPEDPNSPAILNALVENVINDSGIVNWADKPTMDAAYAMARQGLWQAVGQSQVHQYQDPAAAFRAQYAEQYRAARAASAAASKEERIKGLAINPLNIYNSKATVNPEDAEDATKRTEFDFTIDTSRQKQMKQAIQAALMGNGVELQEAVFDNEHNVFKPSGKTMSLADLNKDTTVVTNTRFSPYGNTVLVKDSQGNVKRYMMPAGINKTAEDNVTRTMQDIVGLQDAIYKLAKTGKYTDTDTGKEYTYHPDLLAMLRNQYEQKLTEAYLYHSQIGFSNITKPQELQATPF